MTSPPLNPAPGTHHRLDADPDGGSERVRLARIAHAAALSLPGVVRAESGPLRTHVTSVPGGKPLLGVSCAATTSGGYAVSLRLVASMVPLHPLGETIVERVRTAAAAAGLTGSLESVEVEFVDIEAVAPE